MNAPKGQQPSIVKIDLTPVYVPFKEEILNMMKAGEGGIGMALKTENEWQGGDFVIAELTTDSGHVGVSECFLWLPETGASPHTVITTIKDCLAFCALGESPFDIHKINQRMEQNLAINEVAKGLIDTACYDLMGKISGRPAHDFMGGCVEKDIPLSGLIGLMGPKEMISIAMIQKTLGFKTIRYKLGKSIQEDIKITAGLREHLGDDMRLRVDYNQAYSRTEAVKAIQAIEPYGIDYAEQPISVHDPIGMAYVQKRVNTPLMAHEGCFGLRDIIMLSEIKGVQVVGINQERPGGITKALKAIDYAQSRGLQVALHNQPLGIGSATMLHIAASRYHAIQHATELMGSYMLENDLVKKPLTYTNGFAKVPEGPGLGVELDHAQLETYATGKKITISA